MIFFLSAFSSTIVDFFTRQKISGTHMNFFYVKQLPMLPPDFFKNNIDVLCKSFELLYTSWDIKAMTDDVWQSLHQDKRAKLLDQWLSNKNKIGGYEWYVPMWDEAYPEIHWHSPLAHHDIENNELSEALKQELIEYDAGCPLPPFKWDEGRREMLRAELDAYYALLYGLERDELRYILDPKEVHGEDFPGESFRVLKEKEIRKYGEFRTRCLILEAYDRLRPDWDMEAHRKKLKKVWEKYQENLSEEKTQEKKEARKQVEEKKEDYGQGRLGL
jgi:hypothetical protein